MAVHTSMPVHRSKFCRVDRERRENGRITANYIWLSLRNERGPRDRIAPRHASLTGSRPLLRHDTSGQISRLTSLISTFDPSPSSLLLFFPPTFFFVAGKRTGGWKKGEKRLERIGGGPHARAREAEQRVRDDG